VRDLARNGVEFGAHTKTHPILSSIHDSKELQTEIKESKQRVEQELGKPVIHFCYPNGLSSDFNAETLELVKDAGFLSAVTTEPGLNFAGARLLMLRRIGVDPTLPKDYFAELLSGLRKR
jgi:peptidoglycan/xylan/chitin deacetylase (PgdA/CDA1 family)